MRPSLNGFYLVDKPRGLTSTAVLNRIKSLLKKWLENAGIREKIKVGHSGTLDPFSTGLLVILVGKATRLSEYIINYEKEYMGTMVLGRLTDTLDPEGTVLKEEDASYVLKKDVERVARELSGKEIELEVPRFSAVKKNGVRLYELAREGKEVEVPRRKVFIYEFEVTDFVRDIHPLVAFRAVVGRGVYLRSLANYFASRLGTVGMLESLRRTRIGDFTIEEALPLEEFEVDLMDKFLLPMERLLSRYPVVNIKDARDFFKLRNGASLYLRSLFPDDIPQDTTVAVKFENKLVAVGLVQKDKVRPVKVLI